MLKVGTPVRITTQEYGTQGQVGTIVDVGQGTIYPVYMVRTKGEETENTHYDDEFEVVPPVNLRTEAEIRVMLADVRRIREVAGQYGMDDPVGAKVAEHTLEWVLGERE